MDDVSNLAKILRVIVRDNGVLQPTGHAKPGAFSGGRANGKGKGKGKKGKAGVKGGGVAASAPTFVRPNVPATSSTGDVLTRRGGPFDFGDASSQAPPAGIPPPPPGAPPSAAEAEEEAAPREPGTRPAESWEEACPEEHEEEELDHRAAAKAAKHAGNAGLLAGIFGAGEVASASAAAPARPRSSDLGESPPKLQRTSLTSLFAGLPQPKTAI
eukprot:TRINITY_DN2075_c1_g1_i2.p2 TRINITY_DN2075_c1_g1~~TRINITY_DN2075_c1_g1_i2.p2  ORF type:complete len:214 (-),score=51.72 TRINITY_DN2075_c1_g1_i2:111-752(-)